jgi:hypothetical protein
MPKRRKLKKGLSFGVVWRGLQETRKLIEEYAKGLAETKALFAENAAKAEKEMAETRKELKESAKELDIKMGRISNRLGDIVEHIVSPGVLKSFENMTGYRFTRAGPALYKDNGEFLAQVDLLLENGGYALAVEVKSKPNNGDVDEHIERMGILRQYADAHGDKRKYLAAIAGAVVDNSVRKYALKNGFFVLEQAGADMKVSAPAEGKLREW